MSWPVVVEDSVCIRNIKNENKHSYAICSIFCVMFLHKLFCNDIAHIC